MRLVKGNKEFLKWWNHWMSRIHSTPERADNKTPLIRDGARSPGGSGPTINDGKSNRLKFPSDPRKPFDVRPSKTGQVT
jgi:hypothetical protein